MSASSYESPSLHHGGEPTGSTAFDLYGIGLDEGSQQQHLQPQVQPPQQTTYQPYAQQQTSAYTNGLYEAPPQHFSTAAPPTNDGQYFQYEEAPLVYQQPLQQQQQYQPPPPAAHQPLTSMQMQTPQQQQPSQQQQAVYSNEWPSGGGQILSTNVNAAVSYDANPHSVYTSAITNDYSGVAPSAPMLSHYAAQPPAPLYAHAAPSYPPQPQTQMQQQQHVQQAPSLYSPHSHANSVPPSMQSPSHFHAQAQSISQPVVASPSYAQPYSSQSQTHPQPHVHAHHQPQTQYQPQLPTQQSRRLPPYKLFVGQLALHTTIEELTQIFSPFGNVTEAVVLLERGAGRSKGAGFVVFEDEASAERAIAAAVPRTMCAPGSTRPLVVTWSTDRSSSNPQPPPSRQKRPRDESQPPMQQQQPPIAAPDARIAVFHLDPAATESSVSSLFSNYGRVLAVQMVRTGPSSPDAVVTFSSRHEVHAAIAALNGRFRDGASQHLMRIELARFDEPRYPPAAGQYAPQQPQQQQQRGPIHGLPPAPYYANPAPASGFQQQQHAPAGYPHSELSPSHLNPTFSPTASSNPYPNPPPNHQGQGPTFRKPGSGSSERGPPNANMSVIGLTPTCTEKELEALFLPYGAVKSVKIPLDTGTGLTRGCGYVSMFSPESAAAARNALDNSFHLGKRLGVRIKKDIFDQRNQ